MEFWQVRVYLQKYVCNVVRICQLRFLLDISKQFFFVWFSHAGQKLLTASGIIRGKTKQNSKFQLENTVLTFSEEAAKRCFTTTFIHKGYKNTFLYSVYIPGLRWLHKYLEKACIASGKIYGFLLFSSFWRLLSILTGGRDMVGETFSTFRWGRSKLMIPLMKKACMMYYIIIHAAVVAKSCGSDTMSSCRNRIRSIFYAFFVLLLSTGFIRFDLSFPSRFNFPHHHHSPLNSSLQTRRFSLLSS